MRLWVAAKAQQLANWCDPTRVVLTIADGPLLSRARGWVVWAERHFDNGEARRHQVYARLLKEFPDTPKREIALAIEASVRGL